jgi:hypothetical protein
MLVLQSKTSRYTSAMLVSCHFICSAFEEGRENDSFWTQTTRIVSRRVKFHSILNLLLSSKKFENANTKRLVTKHYMITLASIRLCGMSLYLLHLFSDRILKWYLKYLVLFMGRLFSTDKLKLNKGNGVLPLILFMIPSVQPTNHFEARL